MKIVKGHINVNPDEAKEILVKTVIELKDLKNNNLEKGHVLNKYYESHSKCLKHVKNALNHFDAALYKLGDDQDYGIGEPDF